MVNWYYLLPAIAAAGAGIGVFVWPSAASWPHSSWHLLIGISYTLFIKAFDDVSSVTRQGLRVKAYVIEP
jgi:hypothetical protein